MSRMSHQDYFLNPDTTVTVVTPGDLTVHVSGEPGMMMTIQSDGRVVTNETAGSVEVAIGNPGDTSVTRILRRLGLARLMSAFDAPGPTDPGYGVTNTNVITGTVRGNVIQAGNISLGDVTLGGRGEGGGGGSAPSTPGRSTSIIRVPIGTRLEVACSGRVITTPAVRRAITYTQVR